MVLCVWRLQGETEGILTRSSSRSAAEARLRELEVYLEERAVKVTEVNCQRVLKGDKQEMREARIKERKPTANPNDTDILKLARNCSHFHRHHGFLLAPLTEVERQFPIAFAILTYKTAFQVVDLLRAIYRPQNFYCLHVDQKSPPEFRGAMDAVSSCFPNVFLASRSIDVAWGTFTVLEPQLVCMGDLWRRNGTWRYYINLTGQEFPLKTNYEMVRILSELKGANDIALDPKLDIFRWRWEKYLPAPHNITIYKGNNQIAASRAFVDYVLHEPLVQDFLLWLNNTVIPDELFYNSLHYNSHLKAPGRYQGNATKEPANPMARFIIWVNKDNRNRCVGNNIVREICILNVLHLPMIHRRKELFANKFYAGFSRLALRCLAEELHNRTRDQALGRRGFNVVLYKQYERQIQRFA
ncbi:beta-1,3-galactosyl-O-glycosyl-glycoprotein beta-1,6-N-acetylglucosaminyltransferase 3-like isoform X6 [Babylonia areolata]|uniref:beta-1,3-galactosyl-O-glycosyl-glycoprotein beta-1,6-N-acetylglucosaminyltransferase 3-like isoform X6 n=1 Tax=Babylonia areolata TaxID=304850 RepID=UPI003FD03D30